MESNRLAYPVRLRGLLCGALLLGACASAQSASGRDATSRIPAAIQTIFVGGFGGGAFAREMRDAVSAELRKSTRFYVVDAEATADAVVSGLIGVGLTTGSVLAPPSGQMRLTVRASGDIVWQYLYRDQQSGGEIVVPSAQQQVRTIARQLVAQMLSDSGASGADNER